MKTFTQKQRSAVIAAIQEGHSLKMAAAMAGVAPGVLFNALLRGHRTAAPAEFTLLCALLVIRGNANPEIPKANTRHIARARYERDATANELRQLMYLEVIRLVQEGRIPYEVALDALQMAVDEFADALSEESLTFAVDPVRTPLRANRRGRAGQLDDD